MTKKHGIVALAEEKTTIFKYELLGKIKKTILLTKPFYPFDLV